MNCRICKEKKTKRILQFLVNLGVCNFCLEAKERVRTENRLSKEEYEKEIEKRKIYFQDKE